MKTKSFNATLVGLVPNPAEGATKGKVIRITTGVDKLPHTSITGLFVQTPEAGKRSTGDSFMVNIRSVGKKQHIYKDLKKIADLYPADATAGSAEYDKAIADFNSITLEVNTLRNKCPLYFIYYMKAGLPIKKKFAGDHPDPMKKGQPQFGNKIVDYWIGEESAEERFDDRIDEITKAGMFVTAESSEDVLNDIANPAIKELMESAIGVHQARVDALKAGKTVKTEGKLEDTPPAGTPEVEVVEP